MHLFYKINYMDSALKISSQAEMNNPGAEPRGIRAKTKRVAQYESSDKFYLDFLHTFE